MVRGTLCPALKSIFEHGLKKPSLLGGPCHPWLFIEEVRVALGDRGCRDSGALVQQDHRNTAFTWLSSLLGTSRSVLPPLRVGCSCWRFCM